MNALLAKLPFGKQDLISLGKGLVIAMLGAGLTYLASYITNTNFGVYTPIVVAFGGLVINTARKALDGVKE